MNKKPMSSEKIKNAIIAILIFMIGEIIVVSENEVPNNVKIIWSSVFFAANYNICDSAYFRCSLKK